MDRPATVLFEAARFPSKSLSRRWLRTTSCTIGPARRAGFTLIELLVVVVIVGILTAIAYPSYLAQMRKGHRASAQSYMMNLAQRQGQYLLDARAYASSASALGLATPPDVSPYYTITVVAPATASPPTFTITATPTASQSPDGALTIDEQGTKTPSSKW